MIIIKEYSASNYTCSACIMKICVHCAIERFEIIELLSAGGKKRVSVQRQGQINVAKYNIIIINNNMRNRYWNYFNRAKYNYYGCAVVVDGECAVTNDARKRRST